MHHNLCTQTTGDDRLTDTKTFGCNAAAGTKRCQFRGTREELVEHATETGHKLCTLCPRSLRPVEAAVCDKCVERTRDDLAAICAAHTRLREVAQHAGYLSQPIPGGNAMVQLAGGTVTGGGEADDPVFRDPVIVHAALHLWETEWRQLRDEPTYLTANINSTTVYLRTRLAWAVEHFDQFRFFVADVRDLRSAADHTVGTDDDPVKAPAECFECGGRLIRVSQPPTRDGRRRLESAKVRVNAAAKRAKPASVKERRAMVIKAVTGSAREGLTDSYRCRQCSTEYSWAQYALALRNRAKETTGWVPVKVAAETARVTEKQVRRWIERGLIGCRCDVLTHHVFVWWHDVHDRARPSEEKAS